MVKAKSKVWEYLEVRDATVDKINELGANSWELVSVVNVYKVQYNVTAIMFYLKREVRCKNERK